MEKTINRLREILKNKSKILIVDEAKNTRLDLTKLCKSIGFQHIEEAVDGKAGLEKILVLQPDLVFIDMGIPYLSGVEICHILRQAKKNLDMILILMSANSTKNRIHEAFYSGATDFITKPLNSHELLARITWQLDRLFLHREMRYNYQRMNEELRQAAQIQSILLPQAKLINEIKTQSGLDVAYFYQPASELAGDYISIKKISDNKFAVIMVDVSGHGVSAALYAFSIHTILNSLIVSSQVPGEILKALNLELYHLMPKGLFATMFLGIIDLVQEQLDYAAVAVPSPVILSQKKVTVIDTKGDLLGVNQTSIYETYSVPFVKGDRLFLYSDALIETASADGKYMTEETVQNLLSANTMKTSEELIKIISTYLFESYSATLSDDLSIMSIIR